MFLFVEWDLEPGESGFSSCGFLYWMLTGVANKFHSFIKDLGFLMIIYN